MSYSRELTKEEIEKINLTNTNDLIGQVVEKTGMYLALNELGEHANWFDKNPIEELDKFTVIGGYRYSNPPSGFTGYAWYVKKGSDYLMLDDYANSAWGNPQDACKFYTKSIANRFKDKIEQLCGCELDVVFDEDYHW